MNFKLAKRLTAILFTFCMVLSIIPATTFAETPLTIDSVNISYEHIEYKAGDVPRVAASLVNSNDPYHISYEYWREIHQEVEGGVWSGTGCYWYSDEDKMAKLSPEKRITEFEAGKHYSYNIVLEVNPGSGYFFSGDKTVVTVGEYEWGTPDIHTNLEIKSMSTELRIYSPYSIDIPNNSDTESKINKAVISNAKFDYKPGDVPQKTATVFLPDDINKYEVTYECWEKMENGNPVAYWYSDESKYTSSMKKISQFEEGKSYMYSIELKVKGGYSFSDNCTVMINNISMNASNITKTQNGLFILSVKTITPNKSVPKKEIESVEINDATISFKPGEKPVFTGKIPEGANYLCQCEWWETDNGKTGVNSEMFWDQNYENHITSFESGKIYQYGLYLKANEGYRFTANTKLKINGILYDYKRSENDSEFDQDTMWIYTDLKITPQTSETTGKYKIIEGENSEWEERGEGKLSFKINGEITKFVGIKVDDIMVEEENYTVASGSTIVTLKNEYLKTLSSGEHKITFVYTDGECSTTFKIKNSGEDYENREIIKTGDSSNIILWTYLFVASALGIFGITIYHKNKKSMI